MENSPEHNLRILFRRGRKQQPPLLHLYSNQAVWYSICDSFSVTKQAHGKKLQLATQNRGGRKLKNIFRKLAWNCCIYSILIERNNRLFKGKQQFNIELKRILLSGRGKATSLPTVKHRIGSS